VLASTAWAAGGGQHAMNTTHSAAPTAAYAYYCCDCGGSVQLLDDKRCAPSPPQMFRQGWARCGRAGARWALCRGGIVLCNAICCLGAALRVAKGSRGA
jgi:hypothetical protein